MSTVGTSYAAALFELAKDEQLDTLILEELETLQSAFTHEPDFVRLLATPNHGKDERASILDRSFRGKVHPYVLNTMKLLAEKGLMRHFDACCKAYREAYNLQYGILSVLAVSAVALTPEQSEKLTKKLQSVTGKKILLQNRVDPDCLGGVRLDYDGKRVDGTVRSHLDSIGCLLKNTVL